MSARAKKRAQARNWSSKGAVLRMVMRKISRAEDPAAVARELYRKGYGGAVRHVLAGGMVEGI